MNIKNNEKKSMRRVLQEELTQKKIEKETEYFWQMVERNKKQNRKIINNSRDSEEKKLFSSQGNVGIKFDSYESIPVEKSGPHADSAPPMNSFADLNDTLPDFMIANLQRMRYDVPTPIQKYAIPLALLGHDLMCSAQTGSGKTCAFLFPMITSISNSIKSLDPSIEFCRYQSSIDDRGVHPLAVVLAPTRELAAQIHLESKKICFGSQIRSLVLYGGSEIRAQLSDLSYGCDIIIATPGRLIDIIDRGIISLSEVRCLILDEADRMLDMGFEPQIREIVQFRDMPDKHSRQTLMFSATFKPDIQKLASEFLVDYIWIGVGRVGSTVENIKQNIILSTPESSVKLQLTVDAINSTTGRTLIFVQMKRTAAWLCETLRTEYNIRVDDIHSDKSQVQREASLRRFRDGQVRVLVGTDVAARGLDIPDVAHVIQYDLPHTPDEFDTYVHRVGRTGRAGHVGIATSLFVPGSDGEGNSRIAPLILRLMEETEQEIPEWFRSMAQNKTYSGGHTKQRRGWVNTSSGSSRPVGRGSGSSNFRNHSNRQYQQYTAYHQTDYQDSYYDYASGYVGDYRNAPQYQQRAIQQSYIDSEPDYQEHAASKMQSNRNQSSPSVGSLRLHSLHPAPTLSSISGSQHTTETDEIAHDYSAKEHESLKPPMPTLAKSNFKKEEYRNQGNYQTKKSQPNFNPRTAPSQQYYQAQPTTHLPISPTLEYYGHHIIPTQHPVVPQQPYYAPSNEYPMGYVTAAWPQHQFPSPNYSTYQYPQQVQYGESQGYSPQQGHSPHPGGDHRSSGYGKPFPHY